MIESIQRPEQEFIRSLIDQKLAQSNLSLRQLAKKWDISISFLSQIKNKKRLANLDLAIRIMNEMNISLDEKAYYCRLIQNSKSKKIKELDNEMRELEKRKLLSTKLSKILEGESNALNIFLDITLSEAEGVPLGQIFRDYGNQGIKVADHLSESDIVSKKNNKYFINDIDTDFTPTAETLFGIINKVNEKLNSRVATDNFEGSFNLEIHDISTEGLEELKELHLKQVREVREVIKRNKKSIKKGGLRVSFSHVLGKILEHANSVILNSLFILLFSFPSIAGGVSGGYTGLELKEEFGSDLNKISKNSFNKIVKVINEKKVKQKISLEENQIPSLSLAIKKEKVLKFRQLRADWVLIPIEFNNLNKGFLSKSIAFTFLKSIMSFSKKGLFESTLIPKIKKECSSQNLMQTRFSLIQKLSEDGYVHKSSMKIEEYLNLDFEFRYKVKVLLHIPCKFNQDL